MSESLSWSLRWRLSVLWALQWGITGSLLTYLPLYFTEHQVGEEARGQLMAVAALGLLVAPFVVGQVCDRWMASDKYLAMAHFIGGLVLLAIPAAAENYRDTGSGFGVLLAMTAVHAVVYFPTIPLASALTFRHLPNPDDEFGGVRIWGTVGWVVSGIGLSLWLGQEDFGIWLREVFPAGDSLFTAVGGLFSWLGKPSSSHCFSIAAIQSFALGAFCVFLVPASPPLRRVRHSSSVAVVDVFRMFRQPQFVLLIVISFLMSGVLSFYNYAVPTLLEHLGYSSSWIPAAMTIGQISEFPALILLSLCLRRIGMKMTFAIGMAAWLVRYIVFAAEAPMIFILCGVGLHGVCHVFLIIVIQLYVDQACPGDVRNSAQNLIAFLTLGIATPAGFLLAGVHGQVCRLDDPQHADYTTFFAYPAVAVLVLLAVFLKWGRFSARTDDGRRPSPPEIG